VIQSIPKAVGREKKHEERDLRGTCTGWLRLFHTPCKDPGAAALSGGVFFAVKIVVSALIIAAVSELAKRLPSLGGLIAAMPLTTLLALIWLYAETGDYQLAQTFTRSVLFAIIPTVFFFIAVLTLFKRGIPFWLVLILGFAIYIGAALVHRHFLPDAMR
jgi:chromate transport protein ChrA